MDLPKPKRGWLQYSLRSLLVLVAVCAVPCSWLAVRMQQVRERRAVIAEIQSSPNQVLYDYRYKKDGLVYVDSETIPAGPLYPYPSPGEPPGPAWLRKWLGDDFFASVRAIDALPAVKLASIQHWTSLEALIVVGATDQDLVYLEGLANLEYLDLDYGKVTSAGLNHLRNLKKLRDLRLAATLVDDDGMSVVAELRNLEGVVLVDTAVTFEGVQCLADLPSLRELYLPREQFSGLDIERLRRLMPSVEIGAFSLHDIECGGH